MEKPGSTNNPRWLQLSDQIMGPLVGQSNSTLGKVKMMDFDLAQIAVLALHLLASSLDVSIDINRKGKHAMAISLLRHSIESLTLIDVGLQQTDFSESLLSKWRDGKITSGDLRKNLNEKIWPNYGKGLWNEKWAEYFANLSKAVQPYTHVSRELLEWQLSVVARSEKSKMYVSVGGYDAIKASRITLLHSLVIWTLGRIMIQNRGEDFRNFVAPVRELGTSLSSSKLLMKKNDWGIELLPTMIFTKGDWRDE